MGGGGGVATAWRAAAAGGAPARLRLKKKLWKITRKRKIRARSAQGI